MSVLYFHEHMLQMAFGLYLNLDAACKSMTSVNV